MCVIPDLAPFSWQGGDSKDICDKPSGASRHKGFHEKRTLERGSKDLNHSTVCLRRGRKQWPPQFEITLDTAWWTAGGASSSFVPSWHRQRLFHSGQRIYFKHLGVDPRTGCGLAAAGSYRSFLRLQEVHCQDHFTLERQRLFMVMRGLVKKKSH